MTSAVLSGEHPGSHMIQGIGAGFIPQILDTTVYDEVIKVDNEKAFEFGRLVGKKEGFLVGISSGTALFVAILIGQREDLKIKI